MAARDWYLPPISVHRRMSAAGVGETHGWHLTNYGIPATWPTLDAIVKLGRAPMVGIIDTGISTAATDFNGGTITARRDFSGSDYGPNDMMGHGTHVAGIIAATARNGFGVAGVFPRVNLVIAKALGDQGTGAVENIAEAMDWVVEQGADVCNLSLGSDYPSIMIDAAGERMIAAGCIPVVAAGNSAGEVNYPARRDWAIAVSAFDEMEILASFSCRGPEIDISAPGVEIISAYLGNSYASLSGTSMAAPYVSAQLAVLKASGELDDDWTPTGIRRCLDEHSRDLGAPGDDDEFGSGMFRPPSIHPADSPKPEDTATIAGFTIHRPAVGGDRLGLTW